MSRFEIKVALQALAVRAALPILIRTQPLDRVLQALTPTRRPAPSPPEALSAVEAVTDRLTRRSLAVRTPCLTRALLRYALLRRQGLRACFVIGVRPGGRDGFEAHAWVTLDGRPVMEQQPAEYRVAFIWPRNGAS
jgi:hypothetical protein